jgi:hypothetical protein
MMTYKEAAQLTRSEKITLITMECVERVKLFTADGADWIRSVEYFVVGVKDDGVEIEDWEFLPTEKTLKLIGGADPKTRSISLTYRMFFSNAPLILPYDLLEGEPVEWLPLVTAVGSIGQQLDDENTGIVLETSSSVNFTNSDRFFDDKFDSLIWENQSIKFFSWFPQIPIEQKVQQFEGVIESKSYSNSVVSFKIKDFVYKLKNQVNLGLFTEADGTFLPSILNTPKRRIYGQVDSIRIVSLDATLDGYLLTGTLTGALTALTVSGVGTKFLDEVSPGDSFYITLNDIDIKIGVESVDSDTQLTVSKALEISFGAATARLAPSLPWRKKNRSWHIAGHRLRAPSVQILLVQSANTFLVDSVDDFFAGDELVINGFQTNVRRVSGNKIVTTTNVIPGPSIGDIINKRPIKVAYYNSTPFLYSRDYLETNTTEAKITFSELAEFNISEQRRIGNSNLTFTNGSRTVTTTDAVDLRSVIQTRDWIRSANAGRVTWYEVLSVAEKTIVLRTPVAVSGGPYTEGAYYKSVTAMDENSLVTVNCLGMEVDGVWMRTPADAVRHLVLNDANFSAVNEEKFDEARAACDFTLSLYIPQTLGSSAPLVRDVITNINNSVFGSLYGDSSQNISYSILNSTKPELANIIRDDDILSYTITTTQKIANRVIVNYRPFVDVFSGNDAKKTFVYNSKFVDDYVEIERTIERTLYIYEDDKAVIIAQRIALFNSLSVTSVKIKSKLNLSQTLVNDKIFLNLDRLYTRYGGGDRRKIGSVTGVRKDEFGAEITVTDLGNIYNRVPSIAPNDTDSYTNSDADDKIRWAYILDNDTLTADPTSEVGLGSGVIG